MTINYITGSTELLDAVGPLWEKLNAQHAAHSLHFAEDYAAHVYAGRKAYFLDKAQSGLLRVELAQDTATGQTVGYCVSLVTEEAGAIESIFIEADYRRQGIGDAFMRHALDWMDGHNVSMKRVVVAVGNEQAFGFYERYGFRPRHIVLQQQTYAKG
ncbi:MAG TPA: GNAT family N-acetyltransferase [Anaerolineae bacterium]|nr:GNAT family N-acetyltransferase [Anaerolineae bacterium]